MLDVSNQAVFDMIKRGDLPATTSQHGTRTRYWLNRRDVEVLQKKRNGDKS